MQLTVSHTLSSSLLMVMCIFLSLTADFVHFEAKPDTRVKDEFGYYSGESVSIFQCAVMCAWNESCSSVSYNQSDGACRLSEYRTIAYRVTSEQSWTSLSKKDGKPAYVYVGCYLDSTPRAMPIQTLSGSTTIEMCADVCGQNGTLYFALEQSYKCFCGNLYDVYGPATDCSYPCVGNFSQICGGASSMSVYSFT